MFMRFRGGGIGHKVTRDWDELLQQEGRHGPPEDSDSSDEESESGSDNDEALQRNKEVEEGEEDEPGTEEDDDDDEVHVNGTGRISDGVDDVVADTGEELDEVIWAAEGYDAL